MVDVQCCFCGKMFRTYPSFIKQGKKFCSQLCRRTMFAKPSFICLVCHESFVPIGTTNNVKYCSKKCCGKARMNKTPQEQFAEIMGKEPPDNDTCWPWKGSTYPNGYGYITYDKRHVLAHRVSFSIFNDNQINEKLGVLHKCINSRDCVNPHHLYQGTDADNARDKVEQGRQAKGAMLPHTKLSDEKILTIQQLLKWGVKRKTIAEIFKVTPGYIGELHTGRKRNAKPPTLPSSPISPEIGPNPTPSPHISPAFPQE